MDKKNDSRDFTWVNDDTDNDVYAADGEEAEDLFAAEEPRQQDQPIDLIYPDKSDAEKEEQDANFRESREEKRRRKQQRESRQKKAAEAAAAGEEDEAAGQHEHVRREPGQGRRFILPAILLVIAFLAVVALHTDGFGGLLWGDRSRTLAEDTTVSAFQPGQTRYSALLDGVILSGGSEGITAYNARHELVWSCPFTMQEPRLLEADSYAAVLSLKGNSAIVCNADGVVYSITTEFPVLTGYLNEKGDLAVVTQQGMEQKILVYNVQGTLKLERVTNSAKDGQPMAVALNEDSSVLATAYTDYSSDVLQARVTFYDLTAAGGTYTDRISANFVYQDLILSDLVIRGRNCLAVGDTRMIGYSLSGTPEQSFEKAWTYKLAAAAYLEDTAAVIFGDELTHEGENLKNMLVLYKLNGEESARIALENPTWLQAEKGLLIYGEGRTYTCIAGDGSQKWQYSSPVDISDFMISEDGKSVIVLSGQTFHTMNIIRKTDARSKEDSTT